MDRFTEFCIMTNQDYTISKGLQRWMIENNPPNEVKIINESDHMVMFSQPLKLFYYLEEIAKKCD